MKNQLSEDSIENSFTQYLKYLINVQQSNLEEKLTSNIREFDVSSSLPMKFSKSIKLLNSEKKKTIFLYIQSQIPSHNM